jgi:hypothetical protein
MSREERSSRLGGLGENQETSSEKSLPSIAGKRQISGPRTVDVSVFKNVFIILI